MKRAIRFFAVKTSQQEGCKNCFHFQKLPCICHNVYIRSVFRVLLAKSTMHRFSASIYAILKNTRNYGYDPIRLNHQSILDSKNCFPLFMVV